MKKASFVTVSESETMDLAGDILKESLDAAGADKPLIFYLEGELGTGKTHFVKGLADALGITNNITSPTFVLMKKYVVPRDRRGLSYSSKSIFFHIDCYRIYDSEDALQIGLDEILQDPHAIVAVEWAERIHEIIPFPYWKIEFRHVDSNKRRISVRKISNF